MPPSPTSEAEMLRAAMDALEASEAERTALQRTIDELRLTSPGNVENRARNTPGKWRERVSVSDDGNADGGGGSLEVLRLRAEVEDLQSRLDAAVAAAWDAERRADALLSSNAALERTLRQEHDRSRSIADKHANNSSSSWSIADKRSRSIADRRVENSTPIADRRVENASSRSIADRRVENSTPIADRHVENASPSSPGRKDSLDDALEKSVAALGHEERISAIEKSLGMAPPVGVGLGERIDALEAAADRFPAPDARKFDNLPFQAATSQGRRRERGSTDSSSLASLSVPSMSASSSVASIDGEGRGSKARTAPASATDTDAEASAKRELVVKIEKALALAARETARRPGRILAVSSLASAATGVLDIVPSVEKGAETEGSQLETAVNRVRETALACENLLRSLRNPNSPLETTAASENDPCLLACRTGEALVSLSSALASRASDALDRTGELFDLANQNAISDADGIDAGVESNNVKVEDRIWRLAKQTEEILADEEEEEEEEDDDEYGGKVGGMGTGTAGGGDGRGDESDSNDSFQTAMDPRGKSPTRMSDAGFSRGKGARVFPTAMDIVSKGIAALATTKSELRSATVQLCAVLIYLERQASVLNGATIAKPNTESGTENGDSNTDEKTANSGENNHETNRDSGKPEGNESGEPRDAFESILGDEEHPTAMGLCRRADAIVAGHMRAMKRFMGGVRRNSEGNRIIGDGAVDARAMLASAILHLCDQTRILVEHAGQGFDSPTGKTLSQLLRDHSAATTAIAQGNDQAVAPLLAQYTRSFASELADSLCGGERRQESPAAESDTGDERTFYTGSPTSVREGRAVLEHALESSAWIRKVQTALLAYRQDTEAELERMARLAASQED